MKVIIFFVFFRILLFGLFNHTNLELDKVLFGQSVSRPNIIYYNLSLLESSIKKGEYLAISMNAENDTDPDVYISRNITTPSSKVNDFSCTSRGTDICVIPMEQVLSPNLYISVDCMAIHCWYSIKAFVIKENELKDDNPITATAKKLDAILYKYVSPSNVSTESISIKLNVRKFYESKIFFGISKTRNLINVGTIPAPLHTWGGYIYKFDKRDSFFCLNCTYYILVSSPRNPTEFTISASSSENITVIGYKSPPLADAVSFRNFHCYLYDVKNASEDLKVSLNTFSGNPELHVHPDSKNLPAQLDDYLFVSHGMFDEALVITAKEKERVAKPTGNYTICVFGTYASTYELKIEEQSNEYKEIYDGFTYTSEVKEKELLIFYYTPLNSTTNVKFFLRTLVGNADLYVKYCEENANSSNNLKNVQCRLDINELGNASILSSKRIEAIDFIVVNSTKECPLDKMCYYMVGVMGASMNISRFSLVVVDYSKHFISLKESESTFDLVKHGAYNHYQFTNSDPNVNEIKFELNTYSGDADLYVSRTISFCDCSNAEKRANFDSYLPDTIVYNSSDGSLMTNFYITVHGFTQAYYFINVIVTKLINNTEIQTIHYLKHGEPMKSSLDKNDSKAFFSLNLKGIISSSDIKIALTPDRGQFLMLTGFGFIPSSSNFSRKSVDNVIIFNTNETQNVNDIFVTVQRLTTHDPETFSFAIVYTISTSHSIIQISDGIPQKNLISRNEFDYYKFTIQNVSTKIKVSLISFSGRAKMFVSLDNDSKYPSPSQNDIQSQYPKDQGIIVISVETLESKFKHCPISSSLRNCSLYISVTTTRNHSLYSLTVSQANEGITMLSAGQMLAGSVVGNETDYFFYQVGKHINYTILLAPSGSEKSRFFVKIEDLNGTDRNWVLPKFADSQYASRAYGNIEIIKLNQKDFTKCTKCIIMIGIIAQKNELKLESNYTISIYSNKLELIEGQTSMGFVTGLEYTYYLFYVPCNYCYLTVSLFPSVLCNPDLYINKNDLSLPKKEQSDFSSTSLLGEYYTINSSNPWFAKRNESFKGYYTIGVYSETDCTFDISVSTAAGNPIELKLGNPVSIRQSNEFRTFFFINYFNDFKIGLHISGGNPTLRGIYLNSTDDDKFIAYLPTNEEKAQWSTLRSSIPDTLIISKSDPNFHLGYFVFVVQCWRPCQYSIYSQSQEKSSFLSIRANHPFTDHGSKGDIIKYQFNAINKSEFMIKSAIIAGKIKIYIGTSPNVTKFDYNWTSEGDDVRTINRNVWLNSSFLSFYILVEAIEDSRFTILASQEEENIILSEGSPLIYSIFEDDEEVHLLYDSSHEFVSNNVSEEIKIGFSFRSLNRSFVPEIYISFLSPNSAKSIALPNATYNDYKYSVIDSSSREISSTFYNIRFMECIMAITVKGKFLPSIDVDSFGLFQITTFSGRPIILRPDISFENAFTKLNDYQIFEITTPNVDAIEIKLTPCVGLLNYFITTIDNNFNTTEVKGKRETSPSNIIKTRIENPRGFYSVNVKPNKLVSYKPYNLTQKAIYSIEYSVIDKSKRRIEYVAGNGGKIKYAIERNEIKLEWEKVEEVEEGYLNIAKPSPTEDIVYSIYATNELDSNLDTPCGIKYANSIMIGNPIFNATELKIQLPFPHDLYYKNFTNFTNFTNFKNFKLNIIAQHPNTPTIIVYESVLITGGFQMRPFFRWISILYLILLITLIVIVVVLFRRLRKSQARLEYEMKDIRNMGSIVESIEIKKKDEQSYEKLMKEESNP